MSDINTVYSYFDTYNYTGTLATSSYALPFTPFSFRPRLNLQSTSTGTGIIPVSQSTLSRKRIVWDFGDGTTVEAVTATHAYKEPGRYKVTCYLYDRNGEGYYDTFYQQVNVYNYLLDTLSLSASNTTNTFLTAGKYIRPMLITRSTSWQYYEVPYTPDEQSDNFFLPPSKNPTVIKEPADTEFALNKFNINKPVSIITYVSGASAANYFDSGLSTTHYGHLYPYSSTFIENVGAGGLTEFLEVSSFTTTSTPIYIKLVGTEIVRTTSSDTDSFFCGTTGSRLLYYKDDFPSLGSNVLLGIDASELKPFSNTNTIGYKTTTAKNRSYAKLSITSNGLDSEGVLPNLFPIDKNKFAESRIGVVIKVKDSENFTVKDIPLINYPNDFIEFKLTNGSTLYNFDIISDFGALSSLNSGGFWKGYIIPHTNILAENVYLSASVNIQGSTVRGTSNTFNVYPSGGYYNIAKKGEDVNFKEIFKEIAIQPLFLDQTVLFNDFLGTIFGDVDSIQDSIGKVTYEKIKNFVDNNSVLDYSNIDQLLSIFKTFDLNDPKYSSNNFNTPKELKRLIDLLSINHSRLFGSQNKFKENFKSFGYLNNDLYGKNLGEEVTINHIITAGQDLVAFEKFSGEYKYLNTYLPICATYITFLTGDWGIEGELITETTEDLILTESISSISTDFIKPVINYCLSGYNDTWGWNLVLPTDSYGDSTTTTDRITINVYGTGALPPTTAPGTMERFRLNDGTSDIWSFGPTASGFNQSFYPNWIGNAGVSAPYSIPPAIVTIPTSTDTVSFYVRENANGFPVDPGPIYSPYTGRTAGTSWYYDITFPDGQRFTGNNTQGFKFSPPSGDSYWAPQGKQGDEGLEFVWKRSSGETLSKYYLFYKYVPNIDGTIENGIINFEDSNTTLSFNNSSYEAWSQESGIISNIVAQKLYSKLNLFV
jgi:hypothetical protein